MSKKTAQDIVEDLTLHWGRDEAPEDEDEIWSHMSCVKNCAELADKYNTQCDWGAVVDELEEVISQAAQALAILRNTKDLRR